METNFTSSVNLNNQKQNLNLSSIISCLKTKKECRWFAQSIGKKLIYYLGLYFPPYSCFDLDFMLLYAL